MQAEIINTIIDATISTFSTMCNLVSTRSSIELKQPNQFAYGDVSGIMGYVGSPKGMIAISLPEKLVYHVVYEMLGGESIESLSEAVDGISELTNIIGGSAKCILNSLGCDVAMSFPSVTVGQGHSINTPANIPSFIVGFDSPVSPFWIEICLQSNN